MAGSEVQPRPRGRLASACGEGQRLGGETGPWLGPGSAAELLGGLMPLTPSEPPDGRDQMVTELPASLPLPQGPNRVRTDPELGHPHPLQLRVALSLGSRGLKPRYRCCGLLSGLLSPETLESPNARALT